MRVLLLNNIGCLYKKMSKFDKAFQFFDRAQKFGETNGLTEYAGITYLNISSITSQQGNHNYSLQYAMASLRQF
jgi:tetratricopeptide (TPR) repeat protein